MVILFKNCESQDKRKFINKENADFNGDYSRNPHCAMNSLVNTINFFVSYCILKVNFPVDWLDLFLSNIFASPNKDIVVEDYSSNNELETGIIQMGEV